MSGRHRTGGCAPRPGRGRAEPGSAGEQQLCSVHEEEAALCITAAAQMQLAAVHPVLRPCKALRAAVDGIERSSAFGCWEGAVLMAVGLGTRTWAPRAALLFAADEGEAECSRVSIVS